MSSGKCEVASHCLSLLSYLNFENKQNKQILLHTQNLNYEKYGWISFLKIFKYQLLILISGKLQLIPIWLANDIIKLLFW